MSVITRETVYEMLGEVLDPEVPVLDVVSMGIVRDVSVTGEAVVVSITPTYSGCPAMLAIERLIVEKLRSAGVDDPKVLTVLAPAWTTDWITDEAKEKLRAYGIAPPEAGGSGSDQMRAVDCPFCGSSETRLESAFGSTACKALYVCSGCMQPFEHFKCI
jgi:ring-1,2-phenylacetyl-CoA epoxidase subunit PaaD